MKKPVRIQRKRTKGWKMPDNTVYVGRGSKWGNPYKVGDQARDNKHAVELFKSLVAFFEAEEFEQISNELKGKNLVCWCALDKPCHADVLLKLANEEEYDAKSI